MRKGEREIEEETETGNVRKRDLPKDKKNHKLKYK